MVRQPALALEDLSPGFLADDLVEIPDDHRIRVRAQRAAEDVVGGPHIRDPVAHRLVDRLLERRLAGRHGNHLRAEKFHAGDVQRLALHVHGTHVDHALEAEPRRRRRRGHAMLSGTGLRDDPGLAHPSRQKDLADRVVDLVCPRVQQVLALEINPGPAEFPGQPLGKIQWRRPTAIILQQPIQLAVECRIRNRRAILPLQLLERRHERLGHEHSPVGAKMPGRIRNRFWISRNHRATLAGNPASTSPTPIPARMDADHKGLHHPF